MLSRQRGDALLYPLYRSDSIMKIVVVSILLAGDIHPNPGPVRHPCGVCGTPVAESHRAVCCDYCDQWVHIRCAGISQSVYNRLSETSNEWYCSQCSGTEYPYQSESVSDRQERRAARRQRYRDGRHRFLFRERQRRLEESVDDRETRLATRRQRQVEESAQEREARLATRRQRRLEESADDRETRLATRRQRQVEESAQEREARLATRRQRRLEESADDRETRLATRRQRQVEESAQEREARLATRRQRRLEESADDRETRLATRRQRQVEESAQEREARLATRRQRRLEESADDRETRLATRRQQQVEESAQEREARLATRRQRRLEESADDRETRLATRRQRQVEESAQEREARLATRRQRRLEESADDRETRLATRRQQQVEESAQERQARLATRRQRRLEESADDRETRLATRRQRQVEESAQEREARLDTRRQRRLEESADDRETRLATRRQRQVEESAQEREARLATRRQRRLEESADDRETRLATRRQQQVEESAQEREARLATRRRRRLEDSTEETEQRVVPSRHGHNLTTSRNNYLYEGGWLTDGPLHEQQWVNDIMIQFQKKQDKWKHIKCTICSEMWPIRFQSSQIETYTCIRCQRDKSVPKLFSPQNDMDPGAVPQCLENLTQIEEMLIARACPIMTVYRKHGGQRGYSGHVLNLPQNIQEFLDKLPTKVSALPILHITRRGASNTQAHFRVRRAKVLDALLWLKANNGFYQDIEIDFDNISALPVDGVPTEILQVEVEEACNHPAETGPPIEENDIIPLLTNEDDNTSESHLSSNVTSSFLPQPQQVPPEEDAIRASVQGDDPLQWPSLGANGLNEFQTDGLASKVFPTLFPYGQGDPTCRARCHKVSLTDAFKHLIKYSDKSPDGSLRWRYATHPRFPYWALDMKHRHQLLSQSNIYLQQHSVDANLTIEELQAMVGRMDSLQLMNRLQRYAAKVQGSKQYWFSRYQELKALLQQKGSATFFWTVSSADNYWPQLHSLMPKGGGTPVTHHARVNNVINNPHIADWFFHAKLTDFVKHWLQDTLDANWYWYRYEYQARGSTHAHGCAKLKNDPGLCNLVSIAALGWMEEQCVQEAHANHNLIPHNQHIIQYGLHAKAQAIKYADWLVTTFNTALPDETWRTPDPHPCSVKFADVGQSSDNDYQSLVNCVQRHTRCNAAYCLRRKNAQQEPSCRFGYPMECTSQSCITFERISTGEVRAKLTTARNDPRVNSHNTVVPHTVAKIAICDCPMASGDCLVALIAKLAKMGGV